MKKLLVIIALFILELLIFMVIFSCGNVPFDRLGTGPSVNISFIGRASNRSKKEIDNPKQEGSISSVEIGASPFQTYHFEPLYGENYYKEERKKENRGTLVKTCTPVHFYMDIDRILLYNKSNITYLDKQCDIMTITKNPDGGNIPQNYDLVYAKNIIRDYKVEGYYWEGIAFCILPSFGTTNDYYYMMSVVGVDLGDEYKDVYGLAGDQVSLRDGTIHYFIFSHLQPYDPELIDGFSGFFAIDGEITQPSVRYPHNRDLGPQLFFPGKIIDLTNFKNPSINFYWEMEDLIEVYDNGTPDYLIDDIVTFRLDNPFPIHVVVEEKSENTVFESDNIPPGDPQSPALYREPKWNTIQWINPIDEDFDHVEIIRKADSIPNSYYDGTLVYSGYSPNFCDTNIGGATYYYLIYSVDTSGNKSPGVVLE